MIDASGRTLKPGDACYELCSGKVVARHYAYSPWRHVIERPTWLEGFFHRDRDVAAVGEPVLGESYTWLMGSMAHPTPCAAVSASIRDKRDELARLEAMHDDLEDIAVAESAMDEPGTVPWEDIKAELRIPNAETIQEPGR